MTGFGAAEIKLSFEAFSKLVNWLSKRRSGKELEKLKSEAFQELLKKDTDFFKVKALIRRIRKSDDTSGTPERLEALYESSHGLSGNKIAKKAAAKKVSAKKAAVKMGDKIKVPAKKGSQSARSTEKATMKKSTPKYIRDKVK